MAIFSELFFLLVATHVTMGVIFHLKFHAKWEEMMSHSTEQGREHYLRRARRQFFASVWAAFCVGYDLWFLIDNQGNSVNAFWFLLGLMTLPAIYTLGKYRYDWKDIGAHFKACWTKRELNWH